MLRKKFVKSLLSFIPALMAVPSVIAGVTSRFRVAKGLLVKAGDDRNKKPLSLFEGDTFFSKVL